MEVLRSTELGEGKMNSTATNIPLDSQERRQYDRYDVNARVRAFRGDQSVDCAAVDMSEGGICLSYGETGGLRDGETVELELDSPELDAPARLSGTVRWSRGEGKARRCGVEFLAGMRGHAVKVLAALAVTAAPLAAQAAESVPSFDPQADVNLDGYEGGERPDEIAVQSAFEETFGEIDICVEKARKAKKLEQLPGDAKLKVLLSPKGEKPMGVNAELAQPLSKNKKLNDCLRVAASHGHYPSYDGPPVVVDFEFELDPGYYEE